MKLLRNEIGVFPIHVKKYVKRVFSLHHTSKNRYKNRVLNQKVPSGPDPKGFDSHIDLKMKISAVLLLFGAFVLQANPSYAQKKISLNLENVTVERLLDEIESRTDFRFIYSTEDVDIDRRVSVVVKRQGVSTILNDVFVGTRTTFSVENGQIFLLPNKNPIAKSATVANQDPITVTGQVTNTDGVPLPGVSVIVKGSSRGVASNFDGNYQIVVPNSQSILVFTSIGYAEQEITVGNQTTLNVTLEESVSQLDEVVLNAGYYKVSQKERTGNISKVDTEIIERQPINNPLSAIQGNVAGIQITQNTGVPGGGFDVLIRGQNSILSGTDPLFVINGVPYTANNLNSQQIGNPTGNTSPLNFINPSDIESIEILKDADATSIYGSRGANGVVLITTKKGQAGKTRFHLNMYGGLGEISNRLNLMNREQYLEMRNEAFANDEASPGSRDYDLNGTWDSSRETDWQDELIGGTAVINNMDFGVSGGSRNTQFLLSATLYGESTVFPGDFDFKRTSLNFNINHTSENNKFSVQFSGSYSITNNDLPFSDLTGDAVSLVPVAPALFDDEGNLNWENSTWLNPLSRINRGYEAITDNVIGNVVANYKLLKGLDFNLNLGYTSLIFDEIQPSPLSGFDPNNLPSTGSAAAYGRSETKTWIIEPQLNFSRKVLNGDLTVSIGATLQEEERNSETLLGLTYVSDNLLRDISSAGEVRVLNSGNSVYRYAALYGRVNYNWRGKYLINLTGRRDGSSRFGPDNRFSNFGAIGAAWIFSEEKFLKDNPVLSFGKVRASLGTAGNDQIGDYGFLETFNSTDPYGGIAGLRPTRLFNPDFSWEKIEKREIGLELGLFSDKIFLVGSYYKNTTSNQLLNFPLTPTTGFSGITDNFPAIIENRGLELEFRSSNLNKSNFKWFTTFNISFPRNELTSYPDIENSSFSNVYEVGQSLAIQRRINYLEIDQETGVHVFEDLDNDDRITGEDLRFGEPVEQEFYGGLNNSLKFKGLELDFLFQFVKQTGLEYRTRNTPGSFINQPTRVLDRWQNPGDITNHPQFTQSRSNPAFRPYLFSRSSNINYTDASFIRLRNVSLSYSFPSKLSDKIGLNELKIYALGQNLFTITDYFGFNPEVPTGGARLPALRIISVGASLSF
ncbi:MAG: SusC/RagA family TonB-linked outer membrane protein [Bacteroidota bacterium]